jgi:integrase/recombinase XerD
MKLKNLTYETKHHKSFVDSCLIETTTHHLYRVSDGSEVDEFRAYEEEIARLAETTTKKQNLSANTLATYRNHVIKFIDYLHEAGVMGTDTPLNLHHAYRMVTSYPAYIQKTVPINASHELQTIRALMDGYRPKLGNNSVNVHLNAIEHYINISERYGRAVHDRLIRSMGISPSESEYQPIFKQVWNSTEISQAQKLFWQKYTALGGILGVQNIHGETSQVFSRLPSEDSPVRDKIAITQEQIAAFLNQDSLSDRDRTLFALAFAGGVRISEALMLQLKHIDFTQRKIFLTKNISTRGLTTEEQMLCSAWKGRNTLNDEVHLFGVAEEIFWKSLDKLLVNMVTDYSHDFLFTYEKNINRGRPYLLTQRADKKRSHSNIVKRFKKGLMAIGISKDSLHGPHFARHALVFYLHKECPRLTEDGELKFGYDMPDVSNLIGHVNYTNTVKYKRDDSEELGRQHKLSRDITRLNLDDQKAKLLAEHHALLEKAKKVNEVLLKLEAHQ